MNDEFVTLEQAKELKKLGFREYCYQHYDAVGTLCDNYTNVLMGSMDIITPVNLLKSYNNYKNVTDKWDAPMLSQVHAWLRNSLNMDINVTRTKHGKKYFWDIVDNDGTFIECKYTDLSIKYEDALSKAITKCIQLLKNN